MIRPDIFPPSKIMLPFTSAKFRAAQLVHSGGILKAQAIVALLTVFTAYTVDDFAVGRAGKVAVFDGDRVIGAADVRAAG